MGEREGEREQENRYNPSVFVRKQDRVECYKTRKSNGKEKDRKSYLQSITTTKEERANVEPMR
jgi:hypothetical protein